MIALVGWFMTNVRTCDKGRLWPTDRIFQLYFRHYSSFRYFRVSNQASSSLNQDGGGVDGDYERMHFSHVQCSWGRLPPDFSFKIATVKLTPAFSKLASKSNGGCKRKPKGQKEEGNVGQVIKKRSAWRK